MFGLKTENASGSIQIMILVELSFVIFIMLSGINVILSSIKSFDQFLLEQQSFYIADGGIQIGNEMLKLYIREFNETEGPMFFEEEDGNLARYAMYNALRSKLEGVDYQIEAEGGGVLEVKFGVERIYLGYDRLKMHVETVGTVEGVRSEIVQNWEYEYLKYVEDEDGHISIEGGEMEKKNWVRRR